MGRACNQYSILGASKVTFEEFDVKITCAPSVSVVMALVWGDSGDNAVRLAGGLHVCM